MRKNCLHAAMWLAACGTLTAPLCAQAQTGTPPVMSEQDEDDASCAVFTRIVMQDADADQKARLQAAGKVFKDRLIARHDAKTAQAMINTYYGGLMDDPDYLSNPDWLKADAEEQFFHRCEPQTR